MMRLARARPTTTDGKTLEPPPELATLTTAVASKPR
jgi:hypothetical protein